MRSATVRAAMRRGWVWPISPVSPRPASSSILGSWVLLPDPVSPATTTTWWSRMAARMSSRRSVIGRSAGYCKGSSVVRFPGVPARHLGAHLRCPARRSRGRMRRLLVLVAVAATLLPASAAAQVDNRPPQLREIRATFSFPVTTYVVTAEDPEGDPLFYEWSKTPERDCGEFAGDGNTAR